MSYATGGIQTKYETVIVIKRVNKSLIISDCSLGIQYCNVTL